MHYQLGEKGFGEQKKGRGNPKTLSLHDVRRSHICKRNSLQRRMQETVYGDAQETEIHAPYALYSRDHDRDSLHCTVFHEALTTEEKREKTQL
jgi:hypothetical protein